jgi:hypothetical protein
VYCDKNENERRIKSKAMHRTGLCIEMLNPCNSMVLHLKDNTCELQGSLPFFLALLLLVPAVTAQKHNLIEQYSEVKLWNTEIVYLHFPLAF